MKKLLFFSMLLIVASTLTAKSHTAAERVNTGDETLDSLIVKLNTHVESFLKRGLGKLDLTIDIQAYSYSQNHRWWTPLCHDLIPFDARPNKITRLEAQSKASYQAPCDLLITPISFTSDHRRRSKRILKEINQVVLPIYDLKLMRDKGDDMDFILPFSSEGLKRYTYQMADTVGQGDSIRTIRFMPKRPHHQLLEGEADINLDLMIPQVFKFQGSIDFGKMKDTLRFGITNGILMLQGGSVDLEYKYGKLTGLNHFDYQINVKQLLTQDALDSLEQSYDLSSVYQTLPLDFINSTPKSQTVDTTATQNSSRSLKFFKMFPQRMVSSSDFEAFGSDLRVYGPLNPSFVGYDKINGVTLRQRMRFYHLFENGQSIKIFPEIGFAFRPKALRYRFNTEWTYNAHRRASLSLKLQNGSTGFSSRFKDDVNKTINRFYSNETSRSLFNLHPEGIIPDRQLSFDSLGLQYFNRYEFMLENSIELTNGLRFYLGVDYSIRRPVKHGVYAYVEEVANAALDKRYLDMNPYMRLVWTPHQYYYFDNNQKLYLNSRWPTFSLEVGKGVKNILKSRANYLRIELDAHQHIPFSGFRSLSWHCGSGGFVKQDEEFFVNYTYFARSQYPSSWDRRASGGAFALLDDYWYSSSPGYSQGHIMYETPFLFLYKWRLISRYVIRERLYASALWAQGKDPYGEVGYGIGNNYFNASVFCGITNRRPIDIGVKFSIELDQHL